MDLAPTIILKKESFQMIILNKIDIYLNFLMLFCYRIGFLVFLLC